MERTVSRMPQQGTVPSLFRVICPISELHVRLDHSVLWTMTLSSLSTYFLIATCTKIDTIVCRFRARSNRRGCCCYSSTCITIVVRPHKMSFFAVLAQIHEPLSNI